LQEAKTIDQGLQNRAAGKQGLFICVFTAEYAEKVICCNFFLTNRKE